MSFTFFCLENLYENQEVEDDDNMYAKVDLAKKQQGRKSSGDDKTFNEYFATGLKDQDQDEELEYRVSHC